MTRTERLTTPAAEPGTDRSEAPTARQPTNSERPPQRMTLRARVTWLTAFCVAGAVALVSLGAYMTVRQNLYSQAAQDLTNRVVEMANTRPQMTATGFSISAGTFLYSDVRLDIVDSDGNSCVTQEAANLRLPNSVLSATEKSVAAGEQVNSARLVHNYEVVAVQYPFAELLPDCPHAALVVAQPLTAEQHTLASLSLVLFVISGIGVLVAAAAGTVVARTGLSPVQRLTEATEWVGRTGDLRPIPVTGDDELARLTQSFNAMLGALSESREQQHRLVADAGHELRTPLTSLRTNLELLLAAQRPGAPALSEQDTEELNADVRGQLDELTTLIGDLVELARQDAPQVVHEPVELVDVIERALDRARRRASTVRFDVHLTPWTLLGDASALERAVMNLLDNAVKFSPPNGVVGVVLRPLGDGTTVLEITDQGPGIADADLPHVFERFYRSQEARTLPGSGLGLAIVMQAAQRHGGMAYAGQAVGGGALFALRLPGRPG